MNIFKSIARKIEEAKEKRAQKRESYLPEIAARHTEQDWQNDLDARIKVNEALRKEKNKNKES